MAKWNLSISNFLGGFAPAWYKETYPTYGNKNQAGGMTNVDLTNPGYLTQGPGLSDLTLGTQAGAVTTLVNSILDSSVASDVTYGIGGNLLHKLSSTAVIDDATWPHTINHPTKDTETGEDVCLYRSNLYYSYNANLSGVASGDIGKYDLSSTFDDDWGSTTPTGFAALTGDVPHQMVVGNDIMYTANGRYVCTFDGTTFAPQGLDIPTGAVIESMAYNADRLWIAANIPDLTGTNKTVASIYIWDGTTDTWEAEIKVTGRIGAMYVKNNVIFLWYQDISSTGGYKLAYIGGGSVVDVANYTGGLPSYSQVTQYKDFILWVSDTAVWAFGAGDKDMPIRLFHFADAGYSTVGALSSPFGTPMVASTESTSYRLAKFADYATACTWKSLIFDVTSSSGLSRVNTLVFNFEQLASGARVDWVIRDNKGTAVHSDTISYAKLGAATSAVYQLGKLMENFRIEFDFTNGSTTAPVKMKNVRVYGDDSQ
jgi:hypothetical protein